MATLPGQTGQSSFLSAIPLYLLLTAVLLSPYLLPTVVILPLHLLLTVVILSLHLLLTGILLPLPLIGLHHPRDDVQQLPCLSECWSIICAYRVLTVLLSGY